MEASAFKEAAVRQRRSTGFNTITQDTGLTPRPSGSRASLPPPPPTAHVVDPDASRARHLAYVQEMEARLLQLEALNRELNNELAALQRYQAARAMPPPPPSSQLDVRVVSRIVLGCVGAGFGMAMAAVTLVAYLAKVVG